MNKNRLTPEYKKHLERKKIAAIEEAKKVNKQQLQDLLNRALKHTKIESVPVKKGMVNVLQLDSKQQITILERYIVALEDEAQDFKDSYGVDPDVKNALRHFEFERGRALEAIAKLHIDIAEETANPKKPDLDNQWKPK